VVDVIDNDSSIPGNQRFKPRYLIAQFVSRTHALVQSLVMKRGVLVTGFLCVLINTLPASDIPPSAINTEKTQPPSPNASLRKISVPKGFEISLFAGEPNVAQPIALALDDRGRLWVAEFYSYPKWQPKGHDRIVILEDTDGDGRFDKRKIFWDKGNYLTGLEIGFGGVWVCCAPNLLFIPDKNGDDVPDSKPVVVLDCWATGGHTVCNSLIWGPDGWIYGCNGNSSDSLVGRPGTARNKRVAMNCGVWRYHPTKQVFEVVAHGTANPWGLDFNDYGEGFFTNCVIGHLWHLIPGAHYKRMHGKQYTGQTYQLMDACSDHYHFKGKNWQFSRGDKGKAVHTDFGGGNAHAGAMVYLGGSWPAQYRNSAFMCNLHGNRLNNDLIKRKASGYTGRHGKDFLMANDPWFRGISMKYGPDGGVFVADWTDIGECHERTGVHRTSGRIYKIQYGKSESTKQSDIRRFDDAQLVQLQTHKNDWYVRHARRMLQERAAAGRDMTVTHRQLLKMFNSHTNVTRKLRLLWALHVSGGTNERFLLGLLDHNAEYVRAWAVRLLNEDRKPSSSALDKLAKLAKEDQSALVRLYLASILQRLPHQKRWDIVEGLVIHDQDAQDPNIPLMIWYGIEPAIASDKPRALGLAKRSRIPLLRQFIARRVASP
jgi:putative membrane-bound dehydrogenase-like protein